MVNKAKNNRLKFLTIYIEQPANYIQRAADTQRKFCEWFAIGPGK